MAHVLDVPSIFLDEVTGESLSGDTCYDQDSILSSIVREPLISVTLTRRIISYHDHLDKHPT
jgi:hypothetical protein